MTLEKRTEKGKEEQQQWINEVTVLPVIFSTNTATTAEAAVIAALSNHNHYVKQKKNKRTNWKITDKFLKAEIFLDPPTTVTSAHSKT